MIEHYEAESQYKLQSSDDATTTTPFSLRRQDEGPDGVGRVRDHWNSACKMFVISPVDIKISLFNPREGGNFFLTNSSNDSNYNELMMRIIVKYF